MHARDMAVKSVDYKSAKLGDPTSPGHYHYSNESKSILTLPAELTEHIASFCAPVTAAVLSVTCKSLRRVLGLKANNDLSFNKEATRAFLGFIIDQNPNWLYCSICKKSYEWKKALSYPRYCCPGRKNASHGQEMPLCGAPLYKEVRDLILRYYLRGAESGLPLSYIHHTGCYGTSSSSDKWAIEMEFHPKVVDDSLLLHRVDKVWIPLRSTHRYSQLWKLRGPCLHLGNSVSAMAVCLIHHIESKYDYNPRDNQNRGYKCQKLHHCPYCATDLRLRIEHLFFGESRPRESVLLILDSYLDLGSRILTPRSPQIAHFMTDRDAPERQSDEITYVRNIKSDYHHLGLTPHRFGFDTTRATFDHISNFTWKFSAENRLGTEIIHENGSSGWSWDITKSSRSLHWPNVQLPFYGRRSCELKKNLASNTTAMRLLGLSNKFDAQGEQEQSCAFRDPLPGR